MRSGIYGIINIITGKYYVGSSKNINARLRVHKSCLRIGEHHSSKLQNSWNKHGGKHFRFFLLEECEVPQLIEREQYWIDRLDSCRRGYNMRPRAESPAGVIWTERQRKNLSAALRGKKKSAAHRTALCENLKKAKMAFIAKYKGKPGRPVTAEAREKISKSLTGRKFSGERTEKHKACIDAGQEKLRILRSDASFQDSYRLKFIGKQHTAETKDKIRQLKAGKKMSDEAKRNMSIARKGEKKTFSPEHRRKLSERMIAMNKSRSSVDKILGYS